MPLSDSPSDEADSGTNDSELTHRTDESDTGSTPPSPTADESASHAADSSASTAGETAEASIGTTPAPSTPAAPSFLDTLREKYQVDYSGKYKSDEEAIKGLLHAQQMVGRRDQYAELGRHVEPHWQEFQRWRTAQNAPAGQQQAQPAVPSAPAKDPGWERWIDPNSEDGLKQNTPLEVRSAIEKYNEHYRQWQHKLVYDFDSAVEPKLEQWASKLEERIYNQFQQQQAQVQQRMQADQLRDSHAHWIYQTTSDGKFVVDENGQRIQTPAGAAFIDNVMRLSQAGVTDQQMCFNAALAMTREQFAQMSPAAPAMAAKPPVRTPNSNAGRSPTGKTVDTSSGTTLRERLLKKTEGMPETAFA